MPAEEGTRESELPSSFPLRAHFQRPGASHGNQLWPTPSRGNISLAPVRDFAMVEPVKGLLQRVSRAVVSVEGRVVGAIDAGLCVLVGVGHDDDETDAQLLADRLVGLRIFEDEQGKMNRSLRDTRGGMLVVSQFTLMADTRRGRRPSFVGAAAPERAAALIDRVVAAVRAVDLEVATGCFGAHMDIDIRADGPVTLMLDTKEKRSA